MANDDAELELLTVQLPSGAPLKVHTEDEVDFVEELTEQYLRSFAFEHASDLLDLDKIVGMEMLCWRWQNWLSQGFATIGGVRGPLPRDVGDDLKRISGEVRLLKKAIGFDKATRDKAQGEDSIPYYLATLRQKALVFGVHRVHQLDRALELLNQVVGMATFWKNANPRERREMHHTADDIVTWVLEVAYPEFSEIDRYFRENEQSYWVRDL